MKIEQKFKQKITTFKIYLKQLKNHIFELSKIHRINFFQSNLKKNSKRKFSISIIYRTRKKKKIVATIMQNFFSNAHDSTTKMRILKIISIMRILKITSIMKISKIRKMTSKISKMISTILMTFRIKTILIIKIILIKNFTKIRITETVDMIKISIITL